MTKKLLAILLALLTVVSLSACSDNQEGDDGLDDFREEEVVYNSVKVGDGILYFDNLDSDNVVITGYKGPNELHDLTIPTTVKTGEEDSTAKKVTQIADAAFYSVSALRSVEIPEGITTIGDYAFAMCTQMESIKLPASLEELGRGAFLGSSLKALPLPEASALTEISGWAFSECNGLTEITVPAYIKTVGQGAFASCVNVTKITISEGVEKLENQAFQNTLALVELHLPSTLTNTDPSEDTVFSGSKVLYRENIHCPEGEAGAAARAYADKMHLTQKPSEIVNGELKLAFASTKFLTNLTHTQKQFMNGVSLGELKIQRENNKYLIEMTHPVSTKRYLAEEDGKFYLYTAIGDEEWSREETSESERGIAPSDVIAPFEAYVGSFHYDSETNLYVMDPVEIGEGDQTVEIRDIQTKIENGFVTYFTYTTGTPDGNGGITTQKIEFTLSDFGTKVVEIPEITEAPEVTE